MNLLKKITTSKLILIVALTFTTIVTAFAIYIINQTHDSASLIALTTAVYGVMTATSTFYYSKAKAENKIKLMKENNLTAEQIEKMEV